MNYFIDLDELIRKGQDAYSVEEGYNRIAIVLF